MIAQSLLMLLLLQLAGGKPFSFQERKCVPVQWESLLVGTSATVVRGQGMVFVADAHVSADYDKGVQAVTEDVYSSGKLLGSYKMIYSETHTYFIDLNKKACVVHAGIKPTQTCSDDSELNPVSSYTMGDQMTDTYQVVTNTSISYVTFSRDSFTIMTQKTEIFGSLKMPGRLDSGKFGNVTHGIKDPSVFDVPDYCSTTKVLKGDITPAGKGLVWLGPVVYQEKTNFYF